MVTTAARRPIHTAVPTRRWSWCSPPFPSPRRPTAGRSTLAWRCWPSCCHSHSQQRSDLKPIPPPLSTQGPSRSGGRAELIWYPILHFHKLGSGGKKSVTERRSTNKTSLLVLRFFDPGLRPAYLSTLQHQWKEEFPHFFAPFVTIDMLPQ